MRIFFCELCAAPGHTEKQCPLRRLNEQQEALGRCNVTAKVADQMMKDLRPPMHLM